MAIFCAQLTLSKILVSSDHRLIFTVFWYHALGAYSKSGYLVFKIPKNKMDILESRDVNVKVTIKEEQIPTH